MVIYPKFTFWSLIKFFWELLKKKQHCSQNNQKQSKRLGALEQIISKIMLAIVKMTS